MSGWFYKISKGWLVFISFLGLMALFLPTTLGLSAQTEIYNSEAGSPDMSLFYSPADLMRMAEDYGQEGRQTYIHAAFTFDLIFPLVYTLFFTSSISLILNRVLLADSLLRKLNLIPLGTLLFDLLENTCAVLVMRAFPAQANFAALAASFFTPMKWLFYAASCGVLCISGAIAIWRALQK